jgi:hypothetical protein
MFFLDVLAAPTCSVGSLNRDDLLEGTTGIVYGFTYTYILEFCFCWVET